MNLESILKNKKSRVHFIGIGGVSMSSLAKLLKHDGHEISGSDMNLSDNVFALLNEGITVYKKHSKDNIKDYDLVVYTAAIKKDNEELKKAQEKGIAVIERSVLLGEIMKHYKYPINIAGTHGKTTTTSMLSCIFLEASLNPTISVGGDFQKIGGNLNIGSKDYFICEACEYVESFLKFYPYTSIILNIEADHLDYFKDISQIKTSFLQFANRTNENGFVILNGDDKNCMDIKDSINRRVYTFGLNESNDIYATNIKFDDNGFASFDVYYNKSYLGNMSLGVLGEHNVMNALSCILCSVLYGIDTDKIKAGLKNFKGAKRRFEFKGMFNGASVYDDYAHHPTEIKATLSSIEKMKYNNLYIIFQPHTYSRTKALLYDFVNTFSNVKTVIITEIYAAREINTYNISGKDLADKIDGALYFDSHGKTVDYLKSVVKKDDLVVTIGAGDVYKIGEELIK